MIFTHRDCRRKFAGKKRLAGRAGGPVQGRDAVRRASGGNPCGAGRFWPIATLLVGHDVPHRAAPRASHSAKIGSVTMGEYHDIAL
ncbi:hypothetical protein [Sphingopyxis macrogoltabida]|uniref:hypothetical protein n=1 Tax=Sphingopyxis macrogoltabida TaxID=33050 RepID=UPI0009E68D00|nr:hypothetical protein [Sphingopyxis macrogoltabida]